MKNLLILIACASLLASCSRPKASLEISDPNPLVGYRIKIENTSEGGDTYIKMNGKGTMNRVISILDGNTITDPRFVFQYDKVGTYKVEVFVEDNSFLGGSNMTSTTYEVNVIDPHAKPVTKPVEPAKPVDPIVKGITVKGN